MSQRIRTQLSFLSQREHDDSAGGDIFEVAADFVYIDNECTAHGEQGYGDCQSSALSALTSHKYLSLPPSLPLVSLPPCEPPVV